MKLSQCCHSVHEVGVFAAFHLQLLLFSDAVMLARNPEMMER